VEAGELITEARRAAGLTQAELARRAGTSQPMVARYETGVSSPTVGTLRRVLRAAGQELVLAIRPVTPEELATSEETDGHQGGPAVTAIRAHQTAIRAAARRLGIRNVRIFAAFQSDRGRSPAQAELLVDFPVGKHGLLPLLQLAGHVEDLTGVATDVLTAELMTPDAGARASAVAVPL
jgi:hypothetical protein